MGCGLQAASVIQSFVMTHIVFCCNLMCDGVLVADPIGMTDEASELKVGLQPQCAVCSDPSHESLMPREIAVFYTISLGLWASLL
jgi:hypothetical protein